MKTIFLTAIFSLTASTLVLADDTNVLSGDRARESYAVGMMLGSNWKEQGVDVDLDLVWRGLKAEEAGGPTLLTDQQMHTELADLQKTVTMKQREMRAQEGVKNKTEGATFLAANKLQKGVVTLPDGLQYKVLKEGNGATPDSSSMVKVDYRGTFIGGKEFDSSERAGHPLEIQANHVIPGWTEALTHMKVGSKWEVFIPSDLAYGERGRGSIPPNAVLIFDMDLLDTQAGPPPTSNAPLTSDIIKVPSAAEMKRGAKIETIKQSDIQKYQSQSQTN
ncbi:MAG TPA: FKBP-type peptidyl-prolyl cis-trans isomerase [Verrucomicrobiae bacterium]|nr:FKBP-type peptidyl-prolyl cis-trans isomerase [Verrucomicrobiae bacterium]